MGIEPTTRVGQVTGFEDQGSHQTSFTSNLGVRVKLSKFYSDPGYYSQCPGYYKEPLIKSEVPTVQGCTVL